MEEQRSAGNWSGRVSAGLQAGMLAGMLMLAWIMTGAWVQGQSFWTIPNLLAYTFYGNRMYRPDFVWRTWSGFGFHFFFAGVLGTLFAFLIPRAYRVGSTAIFGALYSLVLYSLAGVWLWDRINPPMGLYARQPFVLLGYVLFGVMLGTVALFDRASHPSPAVPPALPAESGVVPEA